MQPSCSFVYSNRTVGVGYVHRQLSKTINSTYGADALVLVQMSTKSAQTTCMHCYNLNHLQTSCMYVLACMQSSTAVCTCMYLHVCSQVQLELLRWKVVCCGQLTLHWTLDCWYWPSRSAHVTRMSSQVSGGRMSSCSCIATFIA